MSISHIHIGYGTVVGEFLDSVGMILSFVSHSVFLLTLFTCFLLLYWGSCKRVKNGRKVIRILLYSYFILESETIL